ncbi:MAG: hypothetical protein HC836_44520 [Richelia sp. RM2_1_2]|nr:hypothetical protein [Richelia sp. RM2_1_2]
MGISQISHQTLSETSVIHHQVFRVISDIGTQAKEKNKHLYRENINYEIQ